MPSSGSLSIGASIPYLPLDRNGILGKCTFPIQRIQTSSRGLRTANKFGYKDFIPLFKAEKFDADQWTDIFKRSGARYVVPVAEHHDGFAMYKTALSKWNAVEMGPRRDIIGELAEACRKKEMIFGVSSHRIEHWWFMMATPTGFRCVGQRIQ